jgi:hypothetical protein
VGDIGKSKYVFFLFAPALVKMNVINTFVHGWCMVLCYHEIFRGVNPGAWCYHEIFRAELSSAERAALTVTSHHMAWLS